MTLNRLTEAYSRMVNEHVTSIISLIVKMTQFFLQITKTSTSTKPLVLYFAGTPNGFQPTIFFEELKAVYPTIEYE